MRRIPLTVVMLALVARPLVAIELWPIILPEQTETVVRDPAELLPTRLPRTPRPPTVSDAQLDAPARPISLDEAINTALANTEVVRVLAGITAASSGSTIYDVGITNTQVDEAQAVFDPVLGTNHNWLENDSPIALFDPAAPGGARIGGSRLDRYGFDFGLSKQTQTGGVLDFGVMSDRTRIRPGLFPLNPEGQSSVDLSYTQPLLQGGGLAVNRAPILIARINTERSFFQYKASVQRLVRGVIEAYWAVVFARTDLWAREQQVAQAEFANTLTERSLAAGSANSGDVAQTRVALENFRAALLASRAALLDREAALRNILGFPPFDTNRIVPVTPLATASIEFDWHAVLELAEVNRPDLIELKLILEADQQQLLQSDNQASPRLDAVALYRWNGLEGTVPTGQMLRSRPGQFTDWTLGVNFSVPLGLRRERAQLRRIELILARDRANLEQGLHQAHHLLALSLRNLDLSYQQYLRFREVRRAAKTNLDQQTTRYNLGIVQFITVLQAIVDWGNAVSSEAQSLSRYNIELANLELETGTILESHGIAFLEERFGSIGPLGRYHSLRCYPAATEATPSSEHYPVGDAPAEEAFDLSSPTERPGSPPFRVPSLPPSSGSAGPPAIPLPGERDPNLPRGPLENQEWGPAPQPQHDGQEALPNEVSPLPSVRLPEILDVP